MGLFDQLFGGGQQAAQDAAAQKIRGFQQAQAYADPLYEQGRGAITTGYGQAQDLFAPIQGLGQQGAQAYADITGAAGQAGQDRARALFQTDPGYQFARDQALQATQRLQGSAGFQGSGNVADALQNTAIQKANEQYGNYVQRLAPFLGYSLGGTAGAAGQYTGEAGALNQNLLGQANLGYGTQAGIGSAEAAGTLGAAQARAGEIGSALNLGTRLLGYAAGGPIGSAIGSGVSSLFGSGGSPYVNTQGSFPSFLSY